MSQNNRLINGYLLSLLIAMHENILSMHQAGMSYKWIRDTKSHVSPVAMEKVWPLNCWVSKDSPTFAVGANSLHIDHLHQAILKILEDIWELYNEVVGGKHSVTILLQDVVDDMPNPTCG